MIKSSREDRYRSRLTALRNLAGWALRCHPTYAHFTNELRCVADQAKFEARLQREREEIEIIRQTIYSVVADQAYVWKLREIGTTGDGYTCCVDVPGWGKRYIALEGRHVWPPQLLDAKDVPWSDWAPLNNQPDSNVAIVSLHARCNSAHDLETKNCL